MGIVIVGMLLGWVLLSLIVGLLGAPLVANDKQGLGLTG